MESTIFDQATKNLIEGLLPVMIAVLTTILTAIGVKINALLTEKKNAIATQTIIDYICMVNGYVYDAVLEAEQTIVKRIKLESGSSSLSPTEQQTVRESVFEKVKSNTPNNVIQTLEQNGIDFPTLVNTAIEKTVIKINGKGTGGKR